MHVRTLQLEGAKQLRQGQGLTNLVSALGMCAVAMRFCFVNGTRH